MCGQQKSPESGASVAEMRKTTRPLRSAVGSDKQLCAISALPSQGSLVGVQTARLRADELARGTPAAPRSFFRRSATFSDERSRDPRLGLRQGGGSRLANCNALEVPMSRPRKTAREMSEWVLHCAVNQRHIRRSQPTREAALRDACSQLLEGHAVNRIIGPNETITGERVKDWCAKHRSNSLLKEPPRR
jgi:hypothetical protein